MHSSLLPRYLSIDLQSVGHRHKHQKYCPTQQGVTISKSLSVECFLYQTRQASYSMVSGWYILIPPALQVGVYQGGQVRKFFMKSRGLDQVHCMSTKKRGIITGARPNFFPQGGYPDANNFITCMQKTSFLDSNMLSIKQVSCLNPPIVVLGGEVRNLPNFPSSDTSPLL